MVKPPSNRTQKFISGPEFRVWRVARGFSLPQVGQFLGISAQAVALGEKNGLSRKDALALAAIDAKLDPYEVTEEDLIGAVLVEEHGVAYRDATPEQIEQVRGTLKLTEP